MSSATLTTRERRTLAAAEALFQKAFGRRGRLTHPPTIRRFLKAIERLDRYGNFGRGRPGSGLSVLEREIAGILWSLRYENRGSVTVPRHLGYFVPVLRQEARRWKHTWAPSRKAARRGVLPWGADGAGGSSSPPAPYPEAS